MSRAGPKSDRARRELDALDAAVRSIAAVLDLESVLQLIVDCVRDLADAQYAALGIIGPGDRLERFVTSGISDVERQAIGPLPHGHGILGLIIRENRSLRIADISTDSRRHGFPPRHPPMHSFLGVPVRFRGESIGNFYLTNKRDADEFTTDDQALVERFALHAGIAIDNARLHEQVGRLAVVEERDRIGRDLHDGVIQRLYAVTLSLDDVPELMDEVPDEARERVDRAIRTLQSAIGDIRGFIYGLRPALQAPDDLRHTLEGVAAELGRVGSTRVEVQVVDGTALSSDTAAELVTIAREALSNVARHAGAAHARVELAASGSGARLMVSDDGRGFDPTAQRNADHRGLTNMRDRAMALGGRFTVESSPGGGTHVMVDIPAPDEDGGAR